MKIYKLTLDMPGYWGDADEAEKRKADLEEVQTFMAGLRTASRQEESYGAVSYILAADDFAAAVVRFATTEYQRPKLGKTELVMDTIDPMAALLPMLERMELAAARLSDMGSQPGWNEHASAPIPGQHLLGITQLKLLEDCCTDALQEQLDEGWRLVAVCPQEARRPDYVLGRQGAHGQKFGRAER